MTPKCPKCSTDLRDDCGMVTCPACGAIVFVDMDGQAQVAGGLASELAPESGTGVESEIVIENDATPPDVAAESLVPMDSGGMDMNAFLGYTPEAAVPFSPAEASSQDDPNDPLGISAYANSEMSAAKNGPLVVTLIISGIDAKDLRDEIRQALQDSRFGWDTGALMAKIKGGVLRIEQVSPVKATIVINRIKNLSVRIRWEQNAITEIDPFNKEP